MVSVDREATQQFIYPYSPISDPNKQQQQQETCIMSGEMDERQSDLSSDADQPLKGDQATVTTKVYRRRWIMLGIFVLVFMSNAFQWIQFSIINNLITK